MALVPCPDCSRHVRASEQRCPFCDGALPTDLASRVLPSPTRRLDRWATFTFVAALAVAGSTGAGCSAADSDDGQSETDDELRKKKDGGRDAAKRDSGCREVDEDRGGMHAAYGLPPTPRVIDDRPPCGIDAGTDDSDDEVQDAGRRVRDGGGIFPAYGLPRPQ
jgi:hypothetical protein